MTFFNPEDYPFLSPIAEEWQVIRDELHNLKPVQLEDWPERSLYTYGWKVFGLTYQGKDLVDNQQSCPETTRLIKTIPSDKLWIAGFSILESLTFIKPHTGYTYPKHKVYRAHLGLDVPEKCKLTVGKDVRLWKEGEWLVFDDTILHSAFNMNMFEDRAVLLVDFII